VLGVDTADIVARAGGFIYDAIRAGTQVDVRAERIDHDRALRILGVRAQTLSEAHTGEEWPDLIVFAAELRDHSRSVRRLVNEATRRRHSAVALWGGTWPTDLDAGTAVEHQLSAAAQAFKSYAIRAAGVDIATTCVEQFHRGQRRTGEPPFLLRR
jgi:hypothetical protein